MISLKSNKSIYLYAGVLAMLALVPLLGLNNYRMTIFVQALVFSIVVLGLNFITGMTGQMNMGSAAIFGLGAYTSALIIKKAELSPWLGLAGAVAVGIAVGYLLGYPSLRVKGVYLSLTTIGFNEIVRLCLNNLDFTGGSSGITDISRFSIFGYQIKTAAQNYYFLLAALAIFVVISYRIIHSKYGRTFIAIRENIAAVETCGLNLADFKIKAFVLSAVFAAVAGSLYASFVGYISPNTFTTDLSITFVVMLILGGRGSIIGCLLGAFIITFAPELMRFLGDYYKLVYAVMIMTAIIFNPNGLVSLAPRVKALYRRIKSRAAAKKEGDE
jgi:branched-chain amino acid transport system permease protein